MKENRKHLCHSDDISKFEKEIKDLLLYHKIVKAEVVDDQTATLTLDNGVEVITEGNEGCGGCGNGWFYLCGGHFFGPVDYSFTTTVR